MPQRSNIAVVICKEFMVYARDATWNLELLNAPLLQSVIDRYLPAWVDKDTIHWKAFDNPHGACLNGSIEDLMQAIDAFEHQTHDEITRGGHMQRPNHVNLCLYVSCSDWPALRHQFKDKKIILVDIMESPCGRVEIRSNAARNTAA